MVCNYAKLALLTGFALMADAKKGNKYGYRNKADRDAKDELEAPEDGSGFDADSFDSQDDSKFPEIDMGGLAKLLKKRGKGGKKGKGKKGCNEKDFAKGMLDGLLSALSDGDDPNQTITLEELAEAFDSIVGEGFEEEGNRAFDRGLAFTEKKLFTEAGCRDECREDPGAEGCQDCCVSYMHAIDWNCGTDDAAKCCTEWSADCFTTSNEDNHDHACKACGGYGRGYGGWRGRRRSQQGYGGYGRRYGRRLEN